MGVVKGFWEVLKPVARFESPEFLRGKVLAIDLSFWLIQTLSAVKGVSQLRQPHIRLLFFRTIHLVSKLGAFPVFITDGAPPPLKLGVRLDRYSRMTGVLVNKNVGFNVARNGFFTKYIDECVEMLGLLGMPVLQAKHEAEGLCADLNKRGLVDACVTPDSDAFLYGADCVIKTLQADPKEEAWKKKTQEEGWKLKVCEKLYKTEGFPNTEIINIFMNSTHQDSSGDPHALMPRPVKSEALEEFLMDQLFWDRFYVRQKILPLLSFYCLMDLAGDNIVSNACLVKPEGLICGAYAPHSIQCVKISNSKALYRLRWRAIGPDCHQIDWLGMRFSSFTQQRNVEDEKLGDVAEVATSIERESIENDLLFTTDENIELVEKACPDLVHQFRQEQDMKKSNKIRKGTRRKVCSLSLKEGQGQLSITSFFKAKKNAGASNTMAYSMKTEILDTARAEEKDTTSFLSLPMCEPLDMPNNEEKCYHQGGKDGALDTMKSIALVTAQNAQESVITVSDDECECLEFEKDATHLEATPPRSCFISKKQRLMESRQLHERSPQGSTKRSLF